MAEPAAASTSDTRKTLDRFLLATHRACEAVSHERPVSLEELRAELGIPERLAEKIAAFLEVEGLVDYDDQAVDITVDGMLRAEEIAREGATNGERAKDGAARAST